jgi:hypothetical protein
MTSLLVDERDPRRIGRAAPARRHAAQIAAALRSNKAIARIISSAVADITSSGHSNSATH